MNNVTISPEDGWKEIRTESSGTFTLTTDGQHCIYDGVPPDSLVGHRYSKKPVDFVLSGSESVYVRVSRVCTVVGDVLETPSVLLRFAGGDVLRFADGKVLGFKG